MEDWKKHKLEDIRNIEFGDSLPEISATMEIILTMYEVDDDQEIIAACKERLKEGVALLKKLGEDPGRYDINGGS